MDQSDGRVGEPFDGGSLPLIAQGKFDDHLWEFRGNIVGAQAREWISLSGPSGGGGGGGSGGALPFANLGWKILGHIGSYGSSYGGWSLSGLRRVYQPNAVNGVVSGETARVIVRLDDGSERDAELLDSGHDEVRFFLAIFESRRTAVEIAALSNRGELLDKVEMTEPRM